MSNPRLKDFIQAVPICERSALTWDQVQYIFSQGKSDQLVMVRERLYPVGLLQIKKILKVSLQINNLSEPEKEKLIESLIEPLPTLPENMNVDQFGLSLHAEYESESPRNWGIVDMDGKFLGLLDPIRLLKFLSTRSLSISNPHTIHPKLPHYTSSKSFGSINDPLIHLIENLPLPMMLQKINGEVIAQNKTWCDLLGQWDNHDDPKKNKTDTYCANLNIIHQEYPQLLSERGDSKSLTTCFLVSNPSDTQSSQTIFSNSPKLFKLWQFVKLPLTNFITTTGQYKDTILVLAQDVTEYQQLCKELIAKNADLVQLNRLKDEFLACISHELKTPLTAILGLSSLLKDQAIGKLNDRQVRYTGLIHNSGRKLMMIVNDILDLTRIETGQMELSLTEVNIKNICDRALEQTKQRLQINSDEPLPAHLFSLEIEPGLEKIKVDELRLLQMLVNLISNAKKFTLEGEKIGLRVNKWEDWIAFTIWDTGIGIPDEQQHLIFQKFQQLENPLTRRYQGTGIGLVLTQRLAKLHGGDLSFISKEGKGSEFTLLLPLNDTNQTSYSNSLTTLSPSLVLLVESVSSTIAQISQILKNTGYRVVIARSGIEALSKARQLKPFAILLNPLLPLLSGWDLLTLLKSDHPTRTIPIIVISTQVEKDHAIAQGADELLTLPIQPQTLIKILLRYAPNSINPHTPLTILNLLEDSKPPPYHQLSADLGILLNKHHYRLLEADDICQAALLADVWKPHVILLSLPKLSDPTIFMKRLSENKNLASIPLITFDYQTTEAANKIPGLSVFPFLVIPEKDSVKALLQVIQVAAGGITNHLKTDVADNIDIEHNRA